MLSYVLKINNQKLNKNYIETIAGQWVRLNIETVEDAMKIAESEHKKRRDRNDKQDNKKVASKQSWFNTEIQIKKASKEEQAEIDELLKKYKERI